MDNFSSNLNLDKNSNSGYTHSEKKRSKRTIMKFFSTLTLLSALSYGAYHIHTSQPELKTKIFEFINTGTFYTLEARFTANQIMDREKSFLLADHNHKYGSYCLQFHPYLLLEVKFITPSQNTEEGIMLWDMRDGEMIVDARTWEKTHGFADCINAGADRYEYKILSTIASHGGKADRETLTHSLNMEAPVFETWINRARKKHLIVQQGNDYRIHLHNPVLNVPPSTRITDPIVTKRSKNNEKLARRYTSAQIQKAAQAAFGTEFAIRSTRDVFLPVHSIIVQNPDGSLHTSHWNALNGQQITHANLIE